MENQFIVPLMLVRLLDGQRRIDYVVTIVLLLFLFCASSG